MPKYYVRDGEEQTVVDAKDSVSACILAVAKKFNSIQINGHYWVSEKGFSPDPENIKIDSNLVNKHISTAMGFDLEDLIDYIDENEEKLEDTD